MQIAKICFFALLSWSACSQSAVDSLRLTCKLQTVNSLMLSDLLTIYRNHSENFPSSDLLNIHLSLHSPQGTQNQIFEKDSSNQSLATLHANSILGLDVSTLWYPYIISDVQYFNVQKDSLRQVFHPKGYRWAILSESRDISKQTMLVENGKSKAALSMHNFDLAADIGIYRNRRYVKKGLIYTKLGDAAKQLGLFWGGDFKGFPDGGHLQAFNNGAALLRKYPSLSFEYERFRNVYEENLFNQLLLGNEENVQDTQALVIEMNKNQVGKPCACRWATTFPTQLDPTWTDSFSNEKSVYVHADLLKQWVYIKNGLTGYFYTLGNWAYLPKN